MIKPVKLIIAVSCLLYLLIFFLLRSGEQIEHPKFIIYQLSYITACAEEDNVILKISSFNRSIKGVTILARKPAFDQQDYDIFNEPDFNGCDWVQSDNEVSDRSSCPAGYYADDDHQCNEKVIETVFDNGKWRVIADRDEHWQPFMSLIDQDNRLIGEYKSLTIRRLEQPSFLNREFPNIAVIYSDGYLRPTYFIEAEATSHGWGGSFILGDSKFIDEITPRFHHHIKQIRLIKSRSDDPDLRLELLFANRPTVPAKLVFHYDYDEKGIDFFPPQNEKELLTFVSMYRDKSSFDIEFLMDKTGDKSVIYDIMNSSINKVLFSELFFGKKNPSLHNTLSPDFAVKSITDR